MRASLSSISQPCAFGKTDKTRVGEVEVGRWSKEDEVLLLVKTLSVDRNKVVYATR